MDFEFLVYLSFGILVVSAIRYIIKRKKQLHIELKSIDDLKNAMKEFIPRRDLDFMIVDFEPYYIQYAKFPDSHDFMCECVSNNYLSNGNLLNDNQYQLLSTYGFYAPGEKDEEGNKSQNFFKFYTCSNQEETDYLLSELEKLIFDVYEHTSDTFRFKMNQN